MKNKFPFAGKAVLLALFLLKFQLTATSQSSNQIWWKETVFYQVYMPSYADSNGDGYGDFKGMTAKLGYLQTLGVKGIWLTPFLLSPKVDNGYDVADYYQTDPVYGTNDDFKQYVSESHKRGIKVIMDIVLNHTSTESTWFREARKSKDNPYRNYYIWQDKPNNWQSYFGGSAWEKDSATSQYYYHKFDKRMADLNWSNPTVIKEAEKVLRFWLDLGVDGFRFDVINFLTTEKTFPDNPEKDGGQQHVYDVDQAGLQEAIRKISYTVHQYKDRFIVGEIGSDKIDVLKRYQSPSMLDVVFNFNFGSIPEFSVQRIFDELKSMESDMSGYPTLFFGSHDMPRLMDRLAGNNPQKALALAALTLTAKGVPFVYYGEEIGMRNIIANNPEEIKDVQGKSFYNIAKAAGKSPVETLKEGNDHNRDKSRSPMQWDSSAYAGFSKTASWIKVNEDYKSINVAREQKESASLLNQYQQLIALRNRTKALQYGLYESLDLKDDMISFSRISGKEKVVVFINFGAGKKIELPPKAVVLFGEPTIPANGILIYSL